MSEEKSIPKEETAPVEKPKEQATEEAKPSTVESKEDVKVEVAKDVTPGSLEKAEPEAVEVKSAEPAEEIEKKGFDTESWAPKTSLGKAVKEGKIKSVEEILDKGLNILEAEIVDALVPDLDVDLLLIGQSKGKFGGGQRRVFKQTQKKTREGNKPSFATIALVGNKNGIVGIGYGKSRETVPAREKAMRKARLNVIKINRGSGSWEGQSADPHSIPYTVMGKCGSVKIKLIPAPKGTGLVIESELAKILKAAGIKDVWSKTYGSTKTKTNAIKATFDALRQLTKVKYTADQKKKHSITEGAAVQEVAE